MENIEYWQHALRGLIKEVFTLFQQEGIETYLWGGWAADFLAGEVTRPHVDIDTSIWEKDKTRIKDLLETRGFKIREKERKMECYKERKLAIDMYFEKGSKESFEQTTPWQQDNIEYTEAPDRFTGANTANIGDVSAVAIEPYDLLSWIKAKSKYNQMHAIDAEGPVNKTEDDIRLVDEYLTGKLK